MLFTTGGSLQVLILAAGKGTRMKSPNPKVLFEIAGFPMLFHVMKAFEGIKGVNKINVLTGYRSDLIREKISPLFPETSFYLQKEQLGTGHAVKCFIDEKTVQDEDIFIACGDTPLLKKEELEEFATFHKENKNVLSVMSMSPEDPFGYGRIMTEENVPVEIIEEKDADNDQKKIRRVNSGIYIIKESFIRECIDKIDTDNSQGEFYLTDLVRLCYEKGLSSGVFEGNIHNLEGINDIKALSLARKEIHRRINEKLMLSGVDIYDPESTFIDLDVEIEADVKILPFTVIKSGSFIESGSSIGPFARLRQGSLVGKRCKIGNFVETKKAVFKDGVKASHLSYIGDSVIGKGTNIGAGTITCNYDGKNKFKTVIGEDVFIGSNTSLIAPVKIDDNSKIGAGSVISKDVPEYSLSYSRAKQSIKKNHFRRK